MRHDVPGKPYHGAAFKRTFSQSPLTHIALAEVDVTLPQALSYGVGHGLGMFNTAGVEHAGLWHRVINLFRLKLLI